MKQQFEFQYNHFMGILHDAIQQIDGMKGCHSELAEILDNLKLALTRLLEQSARASYQTLHATVWDRLVIAFFGVTNAGKSTLIETFRILFNEEQRARQMQQTGQNVDGLIVGDGSCDFTKVYSEYQMSIHGVPFTLIDVPGIEGNESEFADDIGKALSKAHCVFYVHGSNKQPDEKTLEKVKKYLADWVQVYSIYNVRGDVSAYEFPEDRLNLLSQKVKEAEDLTISSFRRVLGPLYAGNISVQGRLALCAKASFAPEKKSMQNDQIYLTDFFGKLETAYEFSQFDRLIRLVDEKSLDFKTQIVEANKQKLIALGKRTHHELTQKINEQKDQTNQLSRLLCDFKNDSRTIIEQGKQQIKMQLISLNRQCFDKLEKDLCHLIDRDLDEDDARRGSNRCQRKAQRILQKQVQEKVEEILSAIEVRILSKKKTLDIQSARICLSDDSLLHLKWSQKVNTEVAFDEMKLHLSDYAGFAADVAGGAVAVGVIFGPLGAAVGGILSGVSHILRKVFFGDGGKGEAKNKLREEIEKFRKEHERQVLETVKDIHEAIDKRYCPMFNLLQEEKSKLENLRLLLDQVQVHLITTTNDLKNKSYGKI